MNEINALSINLADKFRDLIIEKAEVSGLNLNVVKGELSNDFENIVQPGIDFIFFGYDKNSLVLKKLNEFINKSDLNISVFLCVKSKLDCPEIEAIKNGARGYLSEKDPDRISSEIMRDYLSRSYHNNIYESVHNNLDDFQRELEERVFERTKDLETSNRKLLKEVGEREKVQTELMNAESFLNLILENIPNMIYVKDAEDLTFSYINKAGENLTGFTREDIIGKTVFDMFNIDQAEYYHANDQKVLLLDKPLDIQEEVIYTKGNSLKLFNTKKILVKNDEGESKYIIGISDDVTSEHATRNELKNSEIRFSKIFNSSPIPMTVCRSSDHVLVDANSSYLDLLGYRREELIGKNIDDLGIWRENDMRSRIINDVLKNGAVNNIEIELVTKQGDVRITLMSFDAITFNQEELIICMGLDITNRKQIDNELRSALEKQKELNMLRTQFISMISHEFRTPLTSIMLSTDLLKRYSDQWEEDEKEKHFKRIQDTILKMTQLMENVLLIGRMDSGRFEFSPEQVDFKAFITSTAQNIEFNTGNKYHINLDIQGQCKEVYIDENLLGLIITNLLTNAVKYSDPRKDIALEVECHNDRTATISVIDQGIGIPEKELHHLFKSFYRASNVGSIAGYGLGLHIVKKCVESHNGVIEVQSEVGKGTTFTVTIPIDKPEEELKFDL